MTPEAWALFAQVPIVGIFAVFVWKWSEKNQKAQDVRDEINQKSQEARDKLMQEFWKEQRESDRGILERLVLSVDGLCDKFGEHDQKTASALAVLRDREAIKQRAAKRTT
jgi:hypothetical protein